MGLFSFVKNAGASLFGKKKKKVVPKKVEDKKVELVSQETADEKMANALRSVIESLGLGVADLDIVVKDDVVTVYGVADTKAEKEKIILALGNVAGIGSVDDRMETEEIESRSVDVKNVAADTVFYTVEKGDTLGKIAKAHYGSGSKYVQIFEANKPMLTDPDKIYPGQVLRLPPM